MARSVGGSALQCGLSGGDVAAFVLTVSAGIDIWIECSGLFGLVQIAVCGCEDIR